MPAERIPATKGKPYTISRISDSQICLSRRGNSIPFRREDVAAVFNAIYELLTERQTDEP